ncbi:MAG: phosphoglycerate kinase [Gammaproteobacteria bacterium]|nr:phosphoglycerate kinase [Gammaproteobacteria bacterium]
MTDLNLAGKRVLIRSKLPLMQWRYVGSAFQDSAHIYHSHLKRSLATIDMAIKAGAKVMVIADFVNISERERNADPDSKKLIDRLQNNLGVPVRFARDYLDGIEVEAGKLVLLESCKINTGEQNDSDELAQRYAALCDIFVMDDISCVYPSYDSPHGIAKYAPIACAGPLLVADLELASRLRHNPERPLIIIDGNSRGISFVFFGGSAALADHMLVGNRSALALVVAAGHSVGTVIKDEREISDAECLAASCNIPLITDVMESRFPHKDRVTVKPVSELENDSRVVDIGPETASRFAALVATAKTIIWIGRLGWEPQEGSRTVAHAVAASSAYVVCTNGWLCSLLEQSGESERVNYLAYNTFEFWSALTGETPRAVAILEDRAKEMERLIQPDQTEGQTSNSP